MTFLRRRALLAAGATLATALAGRKPMAAAGLKVPNAEDLRPGRELPEIRFTLADGTPRSLADYLGQGIVLNFWATWCVPCVAEMPALAKLAGLVQGEKVAVLPLSSDRGGRAAVEKFYREREIEGLPVLLDPRGEAARAMGARGIPTTVLIDAHGRERGRLEGAADWADADAVAAVKELAR
ncbi:MAG: TlpA family protein disulfide reductase [Acetobacteraceae bacterium]|nr:TlpA family protein disulfide reductase [Acetobacteraceae bacterium]